MATRFEFVPEETFRKVFDYYGIPQSSVLIFSGILASGLGFEAVINPAFWTVSSFVAIFLGYSLRSYVPSNYAAVLAAIALLAAVAAGLALSEPGAEILARAWTRTGPGAVATQFLALVAATLIIAVGFISHRKHSERIALDLPGEIVAALRAEIVDQPFFYEAFRVEMHIEENPAGTGLRADIDIETVIRNRTSRSQPYPHTYSKTSETSALRQVRVDAAHRDIDDPNVHTPNSIRLSDVVAPRGRIEIAVKISDQLPASGSQIFTSFGMPARAFEFAATSHCGDRYLFWLDVLAGGARGPERRHRALTWSSAYGTLPNQGVRLNWRRRDDG